METDGWAFRVAGTIVQIESSGVFLNFKKLIAGGLLLLGFTVCHADETPQSQQIGPFGGLNTFISQEALPANESPDLLNVDISPGGTSVKKRQGYGLDATLSVSTSAVHNLYKFFDSSGNEVRLAFNDKEISSSINGSAWSLIITTGTLGATWDCTDYLGYAYCVSSLFDYPIKTNGTTSGTTGVGGTNGVPQGTLVSNTGDRLLVGGTPANPSRLYYSQSAVFTNFTLGVQPSDSSFEDIVAPGSRLTHLAYRFGRWLWWKDQSFGFIVGTGQFDLQIVTVSNTIGTFDNTDIFDGGHVYFRGSDNQIYTYDGSTLSRGISSDISPTMNSTNRRKSNLWNQTSQSDFSSGSGYASWTDTTTYAGNISLQGISGAFPSSSSWVQLSNPVDFLTGDIATMNILDGNAFASILSTTSYNFGENYVLSGTFRFSQVLNSNEQAYFGLINVSTQGYYISAYPDTSASIAVQCGKITAVDTYTSPVITPFIPATGLTHTLELRRAGDGIVSCILDDAPEGSFTDKSYQNPRKVYVGFHSDDPTQHRTSASSYIAWTSSGAYYSAVKNAPNLTSWGAYNSNWSAPGASSVGWNVRASTNIFTVLSSTPAWAAQTIGGTVNYSTGTYFQTRVDLSLVKASAAPSLYDFEFNWYEGSASDKMYATYFRNGLWFSVSLGSSTSTNNRIFRYDLLSNLWTVYDIPANGFLTYNNNLYFGDPTAGRIFQFGQNSYSDNGSSINAYWKSKPFFGDSPFSDKDLRVASWYIASDSGTTLTMTYTVNETTTTITKSINLYDSKRNIIQHNWNFPLGSIATNFNAKFGDTSSNAPWEVFGGGIQFVPRPWKVYP